MIGLAMFLVARMRVLGLWIKKATKCPTWALMGHTIKNAEDSDAKGDLNGGGLAQEVSEKNFSMLPRDHS